MVALETHKNGTPGTIGQSRGVISLAAKLKLLSQEEGGEGRSEKRRMR